MSIENNITSLQSILTSVNELPEAGGGGMEVQRVSGTVRVSTDPPTLVNCGFQPDYVTIIDRNSGYQATANFEDSEGQGGWCLIPDLDDYNFLSCGVEPRSDGFEIILELVTWDNSWEEASRYELEYIAVKYS